MGLWSWLNRRKPTNGATDAGRVVPEQPGEQEPMTPEQLADLKDAWAELAEAAKKSAVTGFHACSRGGRPWQEDPAVVRTVAALIRRADKDDVAAQEQPST